MKEKICCEAGGYLYQCKVSHQFIVPISGVGKTAGAAVKPATNRTTTLHRTHVLNGVNKCKREDQNIVHWTPALSLWLTRNIAMFIRSEKSRIKFQGYASSVRYL